MRADLDAGFLHVYGLDRAEAEHVLDSFKVVRKYEERDFGEYRTKRLVLKAYDRMSEAIANGGKGWEPLAIRQRARVLATNDIRRAATRTFGSSRLMPQLALDKGVFVDIAKADKAVAKKVGEVFGEFEAATHTGLHLEPIKNARNPRYRSIRIDRGWRGIVLAPDKGDIYTLLKVLPHDDAYQWAVRTNISVNSATGGIEIRDEVAIEETLPELEETAKSTEERLFEEISDADLSGSVSTTRHYSSRGP